VQLKRYTIAKQDNMARRKSLHKKHAVMIRLSNRDWADVVRAATLESQGRGAIVSESALIRECALPRIREIVAAAMTPSPMPTSAPAA
jgi:hypothetical protein